MCKVLFPYHEGKYCFEDEIKVTVLYPPIDTVALLESWILNPLILNDLGHWEKFDCTCEIYLYILISWIDGINFYDMQLTIPTFFIWGCCAKQVWKFLIAPCQSLIKYISTKVIICMWSTIEAHLHHIGTNIWIYKILKKIFVKQNKAKLYVSVFERIVDCFCFFM